MGEYFQFLIEQGQTHLLTQKALLNYHKKQGHIIHIRQHTLYVDHHTQTPSKNLSEGELKSFSIEHVIGNDTFICTKENPLMHEIYKEASKNYLSLNQPFNYFIYRAYEDIKNSTIRFTGPLLVRTVIKNNTQKSIKELLKSNLQLLISKQLKKVESIELKGGLVLKRVRNGDIQLAEALKNTTHWLKPKVFDITYEQAIEMIKDAILFEVMHFKVLKLDSHIEALINFCKKVSIDVNEAQIIKDICALIKEEEIISLLKEIKLAQVTGKYKETVFFCKENELITIFDLTKEQLLEEALTIQTGFLNIEYIVNSKIELEKILPMKEMINKLSEHLNQLEDDKSKMILILSLGEEDYTNLLNLGRVKKLLENYKEFILDIFQKIEYLCNYSSFFKDNTAKQVLIGFIDKIAEYFELIMLPNNNHDIALLERMTEIKQNLSGAIPEQKGKVYNL